MKPLLKFSLLVLPLTAFAEVPANAPAKIRDAVTHDQLSNAIQKLKQKDPMEALAKTTGTDPSKVNIPKNILDTSDIICFDGVATLVPKQAILAIPAAYRSRLGIQPGVKIIGWVEFYTANRGWITTQEVNLREAEGNKLLADETRLQISKSKNLVVATCEGGPISVLPPKVTAETTKLPIEKP